MFCHTRNILNMSNRFNSMRRARRAAAAMLAFALLGSAATAQQDVREQLEETNELLDDARTNQQRVTVDTEAARVDLAAADARLYAFEVELREREADLAVAEAALAESNSRLSDVNGDLTTINIELASVREELADDQDQFRARVSTAYKHGGSLHYVQALMQAQDFSELVNSGYMVQRVLDADRRSVDDVTVRTLDVVALRREVDFLRETLAGEQVATAAAEEEVARRADTHRQLTTMVAEERKSRQVLVTDLESDLATYTSLVAEYDAQSQSLAAELARQIYEAGVAPVEGDLRWPTAGSAGSPFGPRLHPIFGTTRLHAGVDISGSTGQTIIAAADGRVVTAGWLGGYGQAVVIDHGGGLATLYAHQSVLAVSKGEIVAQGQKIGEVGSTGFSTGPHLHYEIRVTGVPHNPMRWYG